MIEKNVLLVGGGTGGHAAPILAIYKKLKKENENIDITVVGVGSKEEKFFLELLPNYITINSGKVHRNFTFKNVAEAGKIFVGFFEALKLVKNLRPKIIFSKGGYVSLPIILAAKIFKIPYFFHESDIEMGKTNKSMAKSAEKIFVTYPVENYSGIKKEKLFFSGPILRKEFTKSHQSNKKLFGFSDSKPVILVTGGSQGSLNLSKNFLGAAKELLKQFNVIHQAGKHSIQIVNKFYKTLNIEEKKSYYVTDFLKIESGRDMMAEAIDLSDLVISRAGSTIVELSIKKKPMILVPWKHSAQNHQLKNARFFEEKKSAVVILEDELNPNVIQSMIFELFENGRKKLMQLSKNAAKLFPENGTEIICENILKKLE